MSSRSRTDASAASAATAPIVALLVVALALRPQLSAIGPLAGSIIGDLGVSHAYVGLLTTIPVLCMGVFALVGPSLAALVGVRAGIALSVATLLLFAILRTMVPGEVPLLLLTFGLGVGTGVVGPLLPMFVRGRLPGHGVAGTAAYAAGTILGAAIGSGVVVPLELLAGGWRDALLIVSVVSILSLVAWLVLVRGMPVVAGPGDGGVAPAREPRRVALPQLPWRRPIAWAIGLMFGLQSWLYYGTSAWLANVYVERGWDPVGAAGLLTLMSVGSLVAIIGTPWLSARGLSRRTLLAASSAVAAVGLAAVALVPEPAVLWTVFVGMALGMTFTLVLTLPVDISDDQREVGGAAALMLVVGYLIASIAPFALGAVRDATGDFAASLGLLVLIALVMLVFAWAMAPDRLRPGVARESA